MKTQLRVLSDPERQRVHESSLEILSEVGIRVDSALARQYLKKAGAEVNENTRIVHYPRTFIEDSLKLAPKTFTLGARRPGWDLPLNQGCECLLVADGEASSVLEYGSHERRPSTYEDWLQVTRLLDTLDEIGVYWSMVEGAQGDGSFSDLVKYWRAMFSNFSKHIQDPISGKEQAPWYLEMLQILFGDQQTIRKTHPVSLLVCPQSPLILDTQYTEACLAVAGWNIPVAIMPMPLMGGTAPGDLISIAITGNCEVLSMLCLLQAAEPGWPVIYAPALAAMNPRTGLYSAGSIANGLLSAVAVELGKFYNLPVEASGGGTDHFLPCIQAGYERAMTAMLPVMAQPDLLVGPGLLGGSMVLSLEQLLIDVEIFRMSRYAARGIETGAEHWLMDDIHHAGPGGHFLGMRSTADAIRGGEWFHPKLGHHGTIESWFTKGEADLLDEAHQKVAERLSSHQPLPLPEEVNRELDRLQARARQEDEKA